MANKNILLIEPSYRNKYPPLGLMKLAQYHGPNGKKDRVVFVKGEDRSAQGVPWDRIYVTTLFSFEWHRTSRAIDYALDLARGQANRVFVGGIAASLMNERFIQEPRWRGVRFISGLLDQAPAVSLQLDQFEEELYSEDTLGTPIESLVPDYSILDNLCYRYPVHDAYFLYASRGCIRNCEFCGVPKLEGGLRETPSISQTVHEIELRYGTKKDLIFMDNNITASPRFNEIIAEIVDLGFARGATITRNGQTTKRRIDFNQGVDARELAKNEHLMKQLARTCVSPLRIAFDHLSLRKPYETSIRMAAANGLSALSNYLLYNYQDDPRDLYDRMALNVKLNEELGIRIFSFPMRYHPVDLTDRSHVGSQWTRYQLRSIQVILQATHGIVSGAPDFFREAFGHSCEDFENLIIRPHYMIFNRKWYQEEGGQAEFVAYSNVFNKLTSAQKRELLDILSQVFFDLPNKPRLNRNELAGYFSSEKDPLVRDILRYYIPPTREEEQAIWDRQKRTAEVNFGLAADEIVEDSGINEGFDDAGNMLDHRIYAA
ncbi:MAG: radical SAM protein [Magnetococcales bacterium]|nr:radical SAM protein [Magnetococcales bacterium]